MDWTEYNKWLEEGKPYEDEEFIDQKFENESQQRPVGKSIDLYPFYHSFLCIYAKLVKFF